MKDFKELALPQQLKMALTAMGFDAPTAVQEQAIPAALNRRDVIACAQTGTGKTVAFCVPLVARLMRVPAKTALVLVPSRELGMQIDGVLKKLTVHAPGLTTALLVGGGGLQSQINSLARRPRIVVATPGRLSDHLGRGSISLSSTEILVLDEADRMLDMGFLPQLNEILRFIPKTRQMLLFSATLPNDIEKLAARFMKDPVRVTVGEVSKPVPQVTQTVVETTIPKKDDILMDELNLRRGTVLIFTRTQKRSERLARFLEEYGHDVTCLHGGLRQGQRNSAVSGFKNGKFRILVATDLAARGIDISHIAHVINYDLPSAPEDYIHRIGRTARAGATGEALSLLVPEDRETWNEIVRLLASTGSVVKTRAARI